MTSVYYYYQTFSGCNILWTKERLIYKIHKWPLSGIKMLKMSSKQKTRSPKTTAKLIATCIDIFKQYFGWPYQPSYCCSSTNCFLWIMLLSPSEGGRLHYVSSRGMCSVIWGGKDSMPQTSTPIFQKYPLPRAYQRPLNWTTITSQFSSRASHNH